MASTLPVQLNLNRLKKQAKDLLEAHRCGDKGVCPVLKKYLPRFAASADEDILALNLSLHDAQWATARQYGFENWSALCQAATRENPAQQSNARCPCT